MNNIFLTFKSMAFPKKIISNISTVKDINFIYYNSNNMIFLNSTG